MAVEKTPEQEKLAMEALEEIGGGGVLQKIKNMSTAKKIALGTTLATALTYGGHEVVTGGAWTKAAWGGVKKGLWPSSKPATTTLKDESPGEGIPMTKVGPTTPAEGEASVTDNPDKPPVQLDETSV